MIVREVLEKEKNTYNKLVSHVIQSWEWGEFRKKTGVDLVRLGHFDGAKMVRAYQLTFHSVPYFKQTVGYLPKGPLPDTAMVKTLRDLGRAKNAAFVKIEPNVVVNNERPVARDQLEKLGFVEAKKSLFTKYNFLLDLKKSEQELFANLHPKTRYNIGVAKKKGVVVYESTKDEDFEIYLKLYFETTKRQKYFGHTPNYHKHAWETLKGAKMARVLIAKYQNTPLVAWMLFSFGDTLYYPYGGSSIEHREVMASNLVCWEAIRLGQKMGFFTFDMWGALGKEPDTSDPWFGFHRFKAGYNPSHVEYVGTYDLVLNPLLYKALSVADRARWALLRATRG